VNPWCPTPKPLPATLARRWGRRRRGQGGAAAAAAAEAPAAIRGINSWLPPPPHPHPPSLGLFTFSISIKRSYCLAFGFGIFRKIFVGGLPRDTTDGTSIGSFVLCFVAFDACADSRGLEDEIAIPFIQLKFLSLSLSLWSGRWSGWGVVDGMLFTFVFHCTSMAVLCLVIFC
jgi:hypothetical protein